MNSVITVAVKVIHPSDNETFVDVSYTSPLTGEIDSILISIIP